ncbi:PqiC family protein [uncultured Desulfuromonas sp.]|uniref:PqiC family protein n=1 Tax=uncultured Desulfuromonas sp. TaxID=181013 RepID=UPI0026315105|nr:PqiC family protein [uncultured Desulfuromonas sp.]
MMKAFHLKSWPFGLCCLLVLLLAGCGGKSPSVAYYSLASIEQIDPGAEPVAKLDLALGVGPVTVPEYLKKSQIATRLGGRRYQFDEFHRWAGMIEQDLARVIGNNVGFLLGTDKVMFFPWVHYFKPDYRLLVEVIQFDSDLHGDAVLSARWAVSDASGETILGSGKRDYRQALANPSYEALVDAESLVMAEFSRDLAEELRMLALQR